MKYLKKYKSLNESQRWISPCPAIDDKFDLFDDDIISNIEVSKIYHVRNYQDSEKKYAGYVLQVRVEFSDNSYNEENLKNRAIYMKRREEVTQILKYDLHHKNLNHHLSKWNINDTGYGGGHYLHHIDILENTYDEFDLWGLSLDLQTLK